MYDVAMLIGAWLAVLVGLPSALQVLGFDLRMRGRSPVPIEHPDFARQFRPKRLWLALVISVIGLCFASAATYHFFRPRIVEKVVEKPVDRIVEKQVPCPEPVQLEKPTKIEQPKTTKVPNKPAVHPPAQSTQSCPNGICIGGENSGTATVNNFGQPPVRFQYTAETVPSTKAGLQETKLIITPNRAYTPVSLAIVCDVDLDPNVNFDLGPNGSAFIMPMSGLATQSNKVALVKFGGSPIEPGIPLYVHLWSKQPLRILQIQDAPITQRPPS